MGDEIKTTQDELLGTLYEIRFIIMLETSPQSNEYRQILLTHEQFMQVSQLVSGFHLSATNTETRQTNVPASSLVVKLPDQIRSRYLPDEFKSI